MDRAGLVTQSGPCRSCCTCPPSRLDRFALADCELRLSEHKRLVRSVRDSRARPGSEGFKRASAVALSTPDLSRSPRPPRAVLSRATK
jgi:hypothetical protein